METPSSYDQANLRSIFFADYDGTETGFPSVWQQSVQLCERDQQTEPIAKAESEAQASSGVEISVQTEGVSPAMADAMVELGRPDAASTNPGLAEFLARVGPSVQQQLERNLQGHALNDYDVNWGGDGSKVECIHELRFSGAKQAFLDDAGAAADGGGEGDDAPSLPISDLSWNSSGWQIALGFGGCQEGVGWSDQPSAVAVWNLARPLVNPEKSDHSLPVPSCVTSVSFHPDNPAILAAGTLSGQVFAWDLSNSEGEKLLGESAASSAEVHREPIATVSWVFNLREQSHEILSTAADGIVLLWKIQEMTAPFKRYNLSPDSSALRAQPKLDRQRPLGTTALSLSKVESGNFVIGTESGGVHRCFLHAGATATAAPDKSPVVFSYEPHSSVVHDVDCASHHRHVFATSASDGVRVYSMLQPSPLLRLEPCAGAITRVRFSKARPTRLVAGSTDGAVYIFDLHESKSTASQVVRPPPSQASRSTNNFKFANNIATAAAPAVVSMELSGAKEEFLATGDATGCCRIYNTGGAAVSLLDLACQLGVLEEIVKGDGDGDHNSIS